MPTQSQYRKALVKIETVNAAPAILAKVYKLIHSPDVDARDVSSLVEKDTGLSANILRVTRSAYFGLSDEHSDIHRALAQLGFNELLKIINISTAEDLFKKDLDAYGIFVDDFWVCNVNAATLMEKLACATGNQESGEAYTLGLMHSIGRSVINELIIELGSNHPHWDKRQNIFEWEREAVGFTAAEAGAEVLSNWGFPDEFCKAIADQDNVQRALKQGTISTLLHVTQRLLQICGWFLISDIPNGQKEHLLSYLKPVDSDELDGIIISAREEMGRIRKSLQQL